MEIILKKAKINNTILSQTLTASSHDLESFDVLGWCIYKKHHYIILYKPLTNELRKYLMFKEITSENDLNVKVYFGINYNSLTYKSDSKEESQKFIATLNDIKLKAKTNGQFFL